MIGVDFDNTIVCYDGVFHTIAAERGWVPAHPLTTKEELRDLLRSGGREDDWTRLQGEVYGPEMARAKPFPGALEFIAACIREGTEVAIISHRTRFPYLGPRYDLHSYARAWLDEQGVTDPGRVGLARQDVYLEETKADKLARIESRGCKAFVDDLPEFLADPGFPEGVMRVVFDPHGSSTATESRLRRLRSWHDARDLLSGALA